MIDFIKSKSPGIWIALLAICLYTNTLGHDFVLDDSIVITDNQYTQQGISGWEGLLTKDTFFGFFKEEGKANLVAGGRYRPLSPMLFAVVYQLFQEQPFYYHAINILLYGFCVWLLFVFLLKLLNGFQVNDANILASIATIIFAIHPVHTEVVANIKGADEILSLIGALISLLYSLRYYHNGKLKWMAWACVSFFVSLLAKENTITLLVLIPLTWWLLPKTKQKGGIAWITIGLCISTIAYFSLRIYIVGSPLDSQTSMELMNNPFLKYDGNQLIPFSFIEKSGTVFFTLIEYIRLFIFPYQLTHDYYPRHVGIYKMTDILPLLSFLFHIGLLIYSIICRKKRRVISYSILFYLIAMSITSNLFFPIGTNMSERFLFFPSIGLSLLFAYFISKTITWNKKIGAAFLVIVSLMFIAKTWTRNKAWKNNFILFQTDVKVSKNSAKLSNAAAGSLIAHYERHKNGQVKQQKMKEAVRHAQHAIEIHPRYKNAHLLKGNAHLYLDEYDLAITSYQKALQLDASYREGKNNLHLALRAAGRYYGEKKGDVDRSLGYLQRAIGQKPNDIETIRLLGVAYGVKGLHSNAVEYFMKLVQKQPQNAEYWKMLGTAFHNNNQIQERDEAFQKAKEFNPESFGN